MATTTITSLPTATGISATNDWIAIDRTSLVTTQKISRNTLLGITGAPVGDTDTQTLSTKIIGNTNTVTLKDTLFTLQDDGDTTKQAKFQLSGITTATTRTYTLPNASSTLADIATAQIFTNKILTSPTITGGTYDNGTITVDSISGHTSATVVTVGGVQMNNGTIGTSSAVVTASIADSAVTPAKLQTGTGSGWTWQSFTPTWTNLTVGNGTVVARYVQTGKTVQCRISVVFGTTTTVGGGLTFTLPVTAATYVAGHQLGMAKLVAGAAAYLGSVQLNTTSLADIVTYGSASTYVNQTGITAAIPGVWATGDIFSLNIAYEAA